MIILESLARTTLQCITPSFNGTFTGLLTQPMHLRRIEYAPPQDKSSTRARVSQGLEKRSLNGKRRPTSFVTNPLGWDKIIRISQE